MTPVAAGLADLHMHSTASDGMLEVPEILDRARRAGLRAISITDHDTVAVHLGGTLSDASLEVIPGIELSCDTPWGELHVLGYHLDVGHGPMLDRLEELRKNRLTRLDRMVDALYRCGVRLDDGFVADLRARPGSVGRPHVARELIRMGTVTTFNEAFERYLAEGAAAYVPHHNGLEPEDSVRLIRDAGGVASVAHPARLLAKAPAAFLRELRETGLGGIESTHPSHSREQVLECRRRAEELGLVETGGSDFHSDADARPDGGPPAGRHSAIGGTTVSYQVVLELRDRTGRSESCAASPS